MPMRVDPPSHPDRHPSVLPLMPWQSRHSSRIHLPPQFPQAVAPPKYTFGTPCRWVPQPHRDWGIVIGQVYAPDERDDPIRWSWVYLLLLHPDSPSWGWIVADWVDEDDLEPLDLSRIS